jgi:hypothetical protein
MHWRGSRQAPLSWEELVALFDAIFGPGEHELLSYPVRIGSMTGSWLDSAQDQYALGSLEELAESYRAGLTGSISFSRWRGETSERWTYWPGEPRPRAESQFQGPPSIVDAHGVAFDAAFHDDFDGQLILVSWGGKESKSVAEVLTRILQPRFAGVKVFFSELSIDPGPNSVSTLARIRFMRCSKKDCLGRRWSLRYSPRSLRSGHG